MSRTKHPTEVTNPAEPGSNPVLAGHSLLIGGTRELPRGVPRSPYGRQLSVKLHIEQLVLHGFAPVERHVIGDTIQRELTRLITEKGLSTAITRDVEVASLDGGSLELAPGSNGKKVGARLAWIIYKGLI